MSHQAYSPWALVRSWVPELSLHVRYGAECLKVLRCQKSTETASSGCRLVRSCLIQPALLVSSPSPLLQKPSLQTGQPFQEAGAGLERREWQGGSCGCEESW